MEKALTRNSIFTERKISYISTGLLCHIDPLLVSTQSMYLSITHTSCACWGFCILHVMLKLLACKVKKPSFFHKELFLSKISINKIIITIIIIILLSQFLSTVGRCPPPALLHNPNANCLGDYNGNCMHDLDCAGPHKCCETSCGYKECLQLPDTNPQVVSFDLIAAKKF